jgi:acyl-CoA synthetase (AMP-forming)/AMP-acid ligase II
MLSHAQRREMVTDSLRRRCEPPLDSRPGDSDTQRRRSPTQMQGGLIEAMGASMPAELTHALKSQFGASVMAVYAMTECQPIACVPRLQPHAKPGSVRRPATSDGHQMHHAVPDTNRYW